MELKALIMDSKSIKRSLVRISHEIIEKNRGIKDIIIVGIHSRGVVLADYIAENIEKIEGESVVVKTLDITPYRDDKRDNLSKYDSTIKDVNVDDKIIILVDDVLYTGRTVRAALDALINIGRPKAIQLAVLVDRGHRELPIRPDYIGKNVPTSSREIVKVKLKEIDNEEEVVIYT